VNTKIYLPDFAPKIISTKTNNKQYNLGWALSGETILVGRRKDKYSNIYYKNFLTVPKGKFCLYYYWSCGRNQSSNINKGTRCKYLILPKSIPADALTLNALGLLQAEMTKHSIKYNNIIFSNSNPDIINTIAKFFERLGVSKDCWKWSISFNFKLKIEETPNESHLRETRALKYWRSKTVINKNNNQNKSIQYTGNRKYVNMRKDTKIYGTLRICYSNIILYQLILNVLEKIRPIILTQSKLGKYFLQGLVAGEGNVKLTKFGSVDSIRIGSTNLEEKQLYKQYLELLEIESHIEDNYICINNQRNFLKIFEHDLFKLHNERKTKFLNGLVAFKHIPDDVKEKFANVKRQIYI